MKTKNNFLKILLLFCLILFFGCKINQVKNNERQGKWIEFNRVDEKNTKQLEDSKTG